ncbi:MAG: hypothetical protein WDN01_00190 [Rhizomicrobium sp.]
MHRLRTIFATAALLLDVFAHPADANEKPSPCTTLASQFDASPAPAFLASYPGTAIRELKDVAFLYDNAAATLALIGCDDVARARRIGDAILFAQDHDRYWHDGRLRNAYLAGAPANPVKLAGWWDGTLNRWVEDRYQVGSDTGNLAWAALALLALDRATQDPRYRAGALRLGALLEQWRDPRGPGGFTGGLFGHEPKPDRLAWKSTEHNTDLAAAYRALARATGDKRWLADAAAAEAMVRASWLSDCRCFAAGTGLDGAAPNPFLALDAQVFPLLALDDTARYRAVPATLRQRLARDGGYAYSETRAGLWTEGTAQAALLMRMLHRDAEAAALDRALDSMRAPDGTYYAATAASQATGFMLDADPTQPRRYFHIPALAPLAWAALAERRFNPFR